MGTVQLSKKEKKSGYLKMVLEKTSGGLTFAVKRRLALRNGHFLRCYNCGCPKMQKRKRYPKEGKRGGLFCFNCGWLTDYRGRSIVREQDA